VADTGGEEVNRMMVELFKRFRSREEGQALVEYALILALVSVVAIGALQLLGTNVTGVLNNIAGQI
jgi:pilus assembly protein Flp/PilA